jgi:GNAT superfamily N-acetyltransferase
VAASDLDPFFEGWPVAPAVERRMAALAGADRVMLAFDDAQLVGFATAITDGAMSAFIPLLEVLPGYRGRGIGTELVRRLSASLAPIYAISLCCDEDLVPFYERLEMTRVAGMMRHDRDALR